jgi:hypothetical protein
MQRDKLACGKNSGRRNRLASCTECRGGMKYLLPIVSAIDGGADLRIFSTEKNRSAGAEPNFRSRNHLEFVGLKIIVGQIWKQASRTVGARSVQAADMASLTHQAVTNDPFWRAAAETAHACYLWSMITSSPQPSAFSSLQAVRLAGSNWQAWKLWLLRVFKSTT